MHPLLARHLVYPLLQRKERGHVRQVLSDLEQSQWYSAQHLRGLQWARLSALLQHAYTYVPYYRAAFAERGLHPRDFQSIEDIRKLSVLTKETVRDRPRELMADGVKGPLVERRTSGSTGIPLVIYVHPYTRDTWAAAFRRTQRWWGIDVGMREIKLINPHGKSRAMLLKQYWLMNRSEYSVFELGPASLDRLYRRVRRTRCEILAGYPSALTYFAQHVADRGRGRKLRLRAITTTAEVLYPDQRALLQRVFGCPVINEYGSSECGSLAGECPQGNLHIAWENALVEFEPVVSSNGDPAQTEIIVTDLNNFAMPLIRYRIGDLGSAGDPCACGRTLPVLKLRIGRTEDLVTLPDGHKVDGAIFSVAVEQLVSQGLPVKQFRAIQRAPDYIEVLVATTDPRHRALPRLADELRKMLGGRLRVVVRPVDYIPVERSGKLRRFVSLLEAEETDDRVISGVRPH